jgi:hypothetical protein
VDLSAKVADLPLSDMTATANASSNMDFFPQTLTGVAGPLDMDFFAMADHALTTYDTDIGGIVNHHADAVLDNFLEQFGSFDDTVLDIY